MKTNARAMSPNIAEARKQLEILGIDVVIFSKRLKILKKQNSPSGKRPSAGWIPMVNSVSLGDAKNILVGAQMGDALQFRTLCALISQWRGVGMESVIVAALDITNDKAEKLRTQFKDDKGVLKIDTPLARKSDSLF